MDAVESLASALAEFPLVAILRGIRPDEAIGIGQVLVDDGWQLIEVPLNSPQPLESIAALAARFPHALVGAGTVLRPEEVRQVHVAGGRLVVSPNFNSAVVREARRLGMACLPGVATATEAFAALEAGASGLKLFPAEMIPPAAVKALRAVLAPEVALLPVGGITQSNIADYRQAGASGFGIGSSLYRPGLTPADVKQHSGAFTGCVAALRK